MRNFVQLLLMMAMVMKCSSLPTPGDEVPSTLPVPQERQFSIEEPDTIVVKWAPIQEDPGNPIVGVKVKFWEAKDNTEDAAKHEHSANSPPVVEGLPVPSYPPAIIATAPADATTAKLANVKPGVRYWVSLQTYNDQGEGPYSPVIGIQIHHFNSPNSPPSLSFIKVI